MALRLILEVLDHAPDSLTPKEHLAAIVLAENANKVSRQIWDSVEDPQIMARIRVKRARLYELLEGLIQKGVLEQVSVGQKQSRARYRFRELCPPQCPGHADTENKISVRESRNLNEVQRPEDPDVSVRKTRTPTPIPLHQLLSPQRDDVPSVDADAPSRERSSTDDEAQTVLAAYAAALGRPVTNGTRAKLLSHAQALLGNGYPAAWLADRAREIAARGWTDLEQHASRSTVPLPGATASTRPPNGLPPWCGHCGGANGPAARSNARFRVVDGEPCPECHPSAARAA